MSECGEKLSFGEKMKACREKAKAERAAGLRPEKKAATKRPRKKKLPPRAAPGHCPLDRALWDRTRANDFARAWAQRDARKAK